MLDLRGRGNATLLAPFRDLHPRCVSSTPSPSPRSALPDTPSPLFVRESERPQNRFRTFETSISLSVNEQRLNGTHVEPVTIATLPSNSGTSFAGSNFMAVRVRMIYALCDQPTQRPEGFKPFPREAHSPMLAGRARSVRRATRRVASRPRVIASAHVRIPVVVVSLLFKNVRIRCCK